MITLLDTYEKIDVNRPFMYQLSGNLIQTFDVTNYIIIKLTIFSVRKFEVEKKFWS